MSRMLFSRTAGKILPPARRKRVNPVSERVDSLASGGFHPSTFASRFHGNILTFTRSLDADQDAFEARNGLITKRQISQLLTLQVLNDSMEVSIKNF